LKPKKFKKTKKAKKKKKSLLEVEDDRIQVIGGSEAIRRADREEL
jgi:hypothetical protein